jgi:hypothetical protein
MTTLAELKAEAARLNARIAELEGNTANRVTPPPPKDEGVRIVQVLDERHDGMPDLKELESLYAAVKHLAPWPLNNKYDDHKPFRGFCSCFRWVSNKGRTEFPNPRFALSFWLDNCKSWLRDRNVMTGDVSANELVMATLAAGDLKYVAANAHSALRGSWRSPNTAGALPRRTRGGASCVRVRARSCRRLLRRVAIRRRAA